MPVLSLRRRQIAIVSPLFTGYASLLPLFTLAWLGNRLTRSLSWAGLSKVSSKSFNFSSYGTVIGILSVSFLVGDAALLRPLFRSQTFQLVCLLSFTCTILRETFNNWTLEFLHACSSYSAADASIQQTAQ